MRHHSALHTTLILILLSLIATGCKGSGDYPEPAPTSEIVLLGDIRGDYTLERGTYHLEGTVRVREGATLTIEAGTVITAMPGFDKYIIVDQGAKIRILGTETDPVILCPDRSDATHGYWGGLVINGRAPICGEDHRVAEVDEAERDHFYGGDDPEDSSGEIHYLIIDRPGASLTADVEHNGLTLNGVGRGTLIENVAILHSGDDALECFGGTVTVERLLVKDALDDLIDLTDGYSGEIRSLYAIHIPRAAQEEASCFVELDGSLDGRYPTAPGKTSARLSGCTLEVRGGRLTYGIHARRGGLIKLEGVLLTGSGSVTQLLRCDHGEGESAISGTYRSEIPAERPSSSAGVTAESSEGVAGCSLELFRWVERAYRQSL